MGYIRFKVNENATAPVEGGLEVIIDASRILTVRDTTPGKAIDFIVQLYPANGSTSQIRLNMVDGDNNNTKNSFTLKKFNNAVLAAQNSSVVTIEPSGGEVFKSVSYDPA